MLSEINRGLVDMAWVILIFAGLFEVAWALGLRHTQGFTRLWPSVYTLSTMAVSIYLLSLAVARLPTGTAYAVWTGIGAAGTAIFGILFFNEPREGPRIACIFVILVGVAGLKYFSPREPSGQTTAQRDTAENGGVSGR